MVRCSPNGSCRSLPSPTRFLLWYWTRLFSHRSLPFALLSVALFFGCALLYVCVYLARKQRKNKKKNRKTQNALLQRRRRAPTGVQQATLRSRVRCTAGGRRAQRLRALAHNKQHRKQYKILPAKTKDHLPSFALSLFLSVFYLDLRTYPQFEFGLRRVQLSHRVQADYSSVSCVCLLSPHPPQMRPPHPIAAARRRLCCTINIPRSGFSLFDRVPFK